MSTPQHVDGVEADPKKPWKAVVAAVIAFIGTLWANLAGHQDALGDMTTNEWVSVIVTTIIAFGATYSVRNPKVTER